MRIDIVGLSLAETALVLLFTVFVGLLAGKTEENRLLNQASREHEELLRVQRDLTSERESKAELSRQVAAMLPKLRSSAFPSCAEAGKSEGWLFAATVRGRNTYEIGGKLFTLTDLTSFYSKQLQEAYKSECRERVRLYVGDAVSGEEYEYAMRRVAQYFYVGYMGAH